MSVTMVTYDGLLTRKQLGTAHLLEGPVNHTPALAQGAEELRFVVVDDVHDLAAHSAVRY